MKTLTPEKLERKARKLNNKAGLRWDDRLVSLFEL